MRLLVFTTFALLFFSACQNNDDDAPAMGNGWEEVSLDLEGFIVDSKVSGSELVILTDAKYYRLRGEEKIYERDLTVPTYPMETDAEIGSDMMFRTLTNDNTVFLEFQPLQEGGEAYTVDIRDLLGEEIVFPVTRVESATSGKFGSNGRLLFAAFDYDNQQEIIAELEISYNAGDNSVEAVTVVNRPDLSPDAGPQGPARIQNISVIGETFFLDMGHGGTFIYKNGTLTYHPEWKFRSISKLEGSWYAIDRDGGEILQSADEGISWTPTGIKTPAGEAMRFSGETVLVLNAGGQVLLAGDTVEELAAYDWQEVSNQPNSVLMLEFHADRYYLGLLQGNQQVIYRAEVPFSSE